MGGPTVMANTSEPERRSIRKFIAIIVVVVVSIIIIWAVLVALAERGIVSNVPGTSNGTVKIMVTNDDWFQSRSFSISIDGHERTTDTLSPNAYKTYNFDVSWSGQSTHICNIEVLSNGAVRSATTYLDNGGSGAVSITI
jgi:hypothetical protein